MSEIRDGGGLREVERSENGSDHDPVLLLDANRQVLWRSDRPNLTDPSFGWEWLTLWCQKATLRAQGQTAQMNIAAVGDSYSHNRNRWTGGVAELLIAKYGDGGGGWTGYSHRDTATATWSIGVTQPTLRNGNARPTLYDLQLGGTWTRVSNASDGPDLDHITTTQVGAVVLRTVPASPDHTALRVVYVATADGVVRHQVDNGAWTTQNVQGPVGDILYFDIPLTPGSHAVEIEVVSGTVSLGGDNALSSAAGVRFHKLGASGSDSDEWAARDAARQQAGWALLGLDAAVIMLGTNDQGADMPYDTWAENMTTIVTRLRAACPGVGVGIIMPAENQRTNNTKAMSGYARRGRELAWTLRCAYRDLQPSFGRVPADYDWDGPTPLFAEADPVHPDTTRGGPVMRGTILSDLIPF
jgi:lysophospholipase L1-like esterase